MDPDQLASSGSTPFSKEDTFKLSWVRVNVILATIIIFSTCEITSDPRLLIGYLPRYLFSEINCIFATCGGGGVNKSQKTRVTVRLSIFGFLVIIVHTEYANYIQILYCNRFFKDPSSPQIRGRDFR